MRKYIVLLWSMIVASSLTSVYAVQEYADGFCAHYSYSVECYAHRNKVSGKVDAFVQQTTSSLEEYPAAYQLLRLRDLDDKLAGHQQYYANTHWEYLILLLRHGFVWSIAELEEEVMTISVPQDYLDAQLEIFDTKDEFLRLIRRRIVSQMVDHGFDGFVQLPYGVTDASWLVTTDPSTGVVYASTPIYEDDLLDHYLRKHFADLPELWLSWLETQDVILSPSIYHNRKGAIHLFKTTEDLAAIWYGLVSHRVRTNNDADYRRANIATAFDQIWHVRVLNPGDELSYMQDSNFDPGAQQLYQDGFVIFLDEEVEDYGGWLCGGSTAIYQWIVTNTALARPALRNHSKRYHHLYDAQIDGQQITTPGIDSTIYSNSLDLRLRNISNHPVILVSNFEWWYGEAEEVFTVWYPSDKGWVNYVGSRPYHATLNIAGWWSKKVIWECHTWNINGTERESCYKEIKS